MSTLNSDFTYCNEIIKEFENVVKHPVTKPNINIIRRSEENLAEKIDELFETAVNTVETIVVKP